MLNLFGFFYCPKIQIIQLAVNWPF